MITLEIKAGNKNIEITDFKDGDTEINIQEDRPGWNDGGQGIQCNIILNPEQTQTLLNFLKTKLETK